MKKPRNLRHITNVAKTLATANVCNILAEFPMEDNTSETS
jgi:hypothetical protein